MKESDSADDEEEEEEGEEGKASHKKTSSHRGKPATGKNSDGAHKKPRHGSRHNRRPTRSDRIHCPTGTTATGTHTLPRSTAASASLQFH